MSWIAPSVNSAHTDRIKETCRRLECFLVEIGGDLAEPLFSDSFCRNIAGLTSEADFPIEAFSVWIEFLRSNFGTSELSDIDIEQMARAVARWPLVQRKTVVQQLTHVSELARDGYNRLHDADAQAAFNAYS